MSLQKIHLRKILKIMYLEGSARISALRADIREDKARAEGPSSSGGGDFYGPFWRDAKDHVFGKSDLRVQTKIRIEANKGRTNLYKKLTDGFLIWWDKRRRWTNEPFRPAAMMKTVHRASSIEADIKVADILSVRDGKDEDHFVYPYWFPEPALNEQSARLGLWFLCQSFPEIDASQFRILDVIRGQTYSLERNPLSGDEEEIFRKRFQNALKEWKDLKKKYY